MILYKYNGKTRELIGCFEARLDELETIKQNREVFAIPPNSTPVKPFKPSKGHTVIFVNNKWEEIEDNRGLKVYDKKGKEHTITELGVISKDFSKEKPFIIKEVKEEKVKEINEAYKKAKEEKVKIGELEVNLEDFKPLRDTVANLGAEYKTFVFRDEFVSRENIEEAIKVLYIREILLAKRKKEQIKEVMSSRSKNIGDYNIDFNINKEVKRLQNLEISEIDKELCSFN